VVGVMRWLGHIEGPGRTTPALAMTVDYLTTFLGIAGVELPSDRVPTAAILANRTHPAPKRRCNLALRVVLSRAGQTNRRGVLRHVQHWTRLGLRSFTGH